MAYGYAQAPRQPPPAAAPAPRPAAPAQAPTALGYGTDAIAEAGRQGYFDPNGSPKIRAALERRALRSARNRRRRGALTSRLLGLDPQQARAYQLQNETESGQQAADAIQGVNEQEMFGNRDYARSLLGGEIDYRRQRQLADEERKAQGGFWSGVGGLIGTGLGGFAGGYGTALGGRRK